MSTIRTPDQRLRVFVSSTLGELAPERTAVREAIERLRLTPVMFELGARPHPPRELYRAYLDQSNVFVGLYWQRYGWVAPGEDVSGLEDEYRLAGHRPRLLYLKHPAPDREERLQGLVETFQQEDLASYRSFTSPDELAALVQDDLALLLSERFDHERPGRAGRSEVPVPLTGIVGRGDDVQDVVAAIEDGARLVTVTGVGGVGKTRLALEVARCVQGSFDGTAFVPLAAFDALDRALPAVVERLGAGAEIADPLDALAFHLRDRRFLLVLDNAEQIEGLGRVVVELLERTPGLQVLVTSRHALRVRGEVDVPLRPLTTEAAVELFVDRAATVVPRFALDDETAGQVAEIVQRVEGLPLAIELAAARIRALSPSALLDRLGSSLDVLRETGPDRPERHRTLRATLDWSFGLLTEEEQALYARLGVFAGGWTLAAAQAVAADPGDGDVLEPLASLLDKSLVVADREQAHADPRFRMLEPVRVDAGERLDARGETTALRRRHLAWCRALADEAQPHLCGPGQREWVERIGTERANMARAVANAFELGELGEVVELTWDLVVFYFVRDAVDEPDAWLREVDRRREALDEVTTAKQRCLLALTRIHHGDYTDVHDALLEPLRVFRARGMRFEAAVALHQLGFVRFQVDGDLDAAAEALRESSSLFVDLDHDWGVSLVEAMLGSLHAAAGDLTAAEACQERALAHARRIESDQQVAQALDQLALIRLLQERYDEALQLLAQSAPILRQGGFRTEAANALDALAVIAHQEGATHLARSAVTAAAAERQRLGVEPWPTLRPFIERIRRWTGDDHAPEPGVASDPAVSEASVFDTLDRTLGTIGALDGPRGAYFSAPASSPWTK